MQNTHMNFFSGRFILSKEKLEKLAFGQILKSMETDEEVVGLQQEGHI